MQSIAIPDSQSQPRGRRTCPDCSSKLYGATSIIQKPARVTWICRQPGCGYVGTTLPLIVPRCVCSAVIPPGTGQEFHATVGTVKICTACTETYPGGAPKEILDQHQRITRALEDAERYDFARGTEQHRPVVMVTKRESGAVYTVRLGEEPYTCTCPDYADRCAGKTLRCKHVFMALRWLEMQPARPEPEPGPAPVTTATDAEAELARAYEARLQQIEQQRVHAQAALDRRVSEAKAEADQRYHAALRALEAERKAAWERTRDQLWG